MTVQASDGRAPARHTRIGILGAGFGGLGLAIRLKQAGIDDFTVWERDADVGGTWWANTYPGCQCDIPSHLYSFSFAPNPDWTRTYPLQPEIREYLRECADRYRVRDRIRFDCEVTARGVGRGRGRVAGRDQRTDRSPPNSCSRRRASSASPRSRRSRGSSASRA